MKKSTALTMLGTLIIVSLINTAVPAFASTKQSALSTVSITTAKVNSATRWDGSRPRQHWPHAYRVWRGHRREYNQNFCGNSDNGNSDIFHGHNQDNTGNQGDNEGYARDNSVNNGNQLIHEKPFAGNQRSNQFFCGNSDNNNRIYTRGYNQDNSGNQGINRGYSQDNSTNNGNQIID